MRAGFQVWQPRRAGRLSNLDDDVADPPRREPAAPRSEARTAVAAEPASKPAPAAPPLRGGARAKGRSGAAAQPAGADALSKERAAALEPASVATAGAPAAAADVGDVSASADAQQRSRRGRRGGRRQQQ